MPDRPTVIYQYDGTFDGLLCCVFESFDKKEMPFQIAMADALQLMLYPIKEIATDEVKAERVWNSIPLKISAEAMELVRLGFLTCAPQKELLILRFLRLGFHYGASVTNMLANDTVNSLQKAIQFLKNERHAMIEFLRFSVYGKVMVAVIEPKNEVLSLMADHFCTRYAWETFLIYDKTHRLALVYQPREYKLIPIENLELPEPGLEETEYRTLWKLFYNTIAIEGRYNPVCRRSHMPKRYWANMTEFEDGDLLKLSPEEIKLEPDPVLLIP